MRPARWPAPSPPSGLQVLFGPVTAGAVPDTEANRNALAALAARNARRTSSAMQDLLRRLDVVDHHVDDGQVTAAASSPAP